jgi:hypothetical protein
MSKIRGFSDATVRNLKIKACVCAAVENYKKAAYYFAMVLAKDTGDRLARRGLTEVCGRMARND